MSPKELNFCLTDHPDLLNDIYSEVENVLCGAKSIFDAESAGLIHCARSFERLDIGTLVEGILLAAEEAFEDRPKHLIHRVQLSPDFDWVTCWSCGRVTMHIVQSDFFFSHSFRQGSFCRKFVHSLNHPVQHIIVRAYDVQQSTIDELKSSHFCSPAVATDGVAYSSFFSSRLYSSLMPVFVIKREHVKTSENVETLSEPALDAYQIPSLKEFLYFTLQAFRRWDVIKPQPSKLFVIEEVQAKEVLVAFCLTKAYIDLVNIQVNPLNAFDVLSALWGDKVGSSFEAKGWLSEYPEIVEVLNYAGKSTLANFARETHQKWFAGWSNEGGFPTDELNSLDYKIGLSAFFKSSAFCRPNTVKSISYLGPEDTEIYTKTSQVLSDSATIVRCGNLMSFVTPDMRTHLRDTLGLTNEDLSSETLAARLLPLQVVARLHEQFYKTAVNSVTTA